VAHLPPVDAPGAKPQTLMIRNSGFHPEWNSDREWNCDRGQDAYYIDLKHCLSSAEVLDWIFQISNKAWATPTVIRGMIHALNVAIEPQHNLCSRGVDKKMTVDEMQKQLLERFGIEE
jgi:hypothetical protein